MSRAREVPERIQRGVVAAIACGRYSVAVALVRVHVGRTSDAQQIVADIARLAFHYPDDPEMYDHAPT